MACLKIGIKSLRIHIIDLELCTHTSHIQNHKGTSKGAQNCYTTSALILSNRWQDDIASLPCRVPSVPDGFGNTPEVEYCKGSCLYRMLELDGPSDSIW